MKTSKLIVKSVKLTQEDIEFFVRVGRGNFSAGIVKAKEEYTGFVPRMKPEWMVPQGSKT